MIIKGCRERSAFGKTKKKRKKKDKLSLKQDPVQTFQRKAQRSQPRHLQRTNNRMFLIRVLGSVGDHPSGDRNTQVCLWSIRQTHTHPSSWGRARICCCCKQPHNSKWAGIRSFGPVAHQVITFPSEMGVALTPRACWRQTPILSGNVQKADNALIWPEAFIIKCEAAVRGSEIRTKRF